MAWQGREITNNTLISSHLSRLLSIGTRGLLILSGGVVCGHEDRINKKETKGGGGLGRKSSRLSVPVFDE